MISNNTFGDYASQLWLYLIVLTPVHIALILISIAVLLPMLIFSRSRFVLCARSITVFLLSLLITGAVLNIFWNVFVFDKLYWTYDYTAFECSPFGLLIYEDSYWPAKYFRGADEIIIRYWHSLYLILSWTGAYLISLFVNRTLDRNKEIRGKQSVR
jgi:hypothetical protein